MEHAISLVYLEAYYQIRTYDSNSHEMVSAVVEKDLSSHPHLKSDAVGSAVYSTAAVPIRAAMFKYLSSVFKLSICITKYDKRSKNEEKNKHNS